MPRRFLETVVGEMKSDKPVGVILAAGVGSRLRPLTQNKPKCLVKVAGVPMLTYQLDAYHRAGIEEVLIVVGYEAEAVIEHCRHIKSPKIKIVRNSEYEETNNMYSLYLLRDQIAGRPFILNNGDLVTDSILVKRLIEADYADLVAVDTGIFNDESMKVSIRSDQTISDISKTIEAANSYGASLDYYKFSQAASQILFSEIKGIIVDSRNRKEWTEVAMQRLFKAGALKFKPLNVAGLSWVEVDNYLDLALADKTFSQFNRWRSTINTYFFDLDGTVYVGSKAIDGAAETIRQLRRDGKAVYFISNNSSKARDDYVERLVGMGIECRESDIILSTDAVINFLKKENVESVFPLGTQKFCTALSSAGIDLKSVNPEYVVVGYDTELTYEKLATACLFINSGVDYLVTHPDLFCPSEGGPIPDAGAITKLLEATTGRAPLRIFGKPSPDTIRYHLEEKNIAPVECALVGDRLHTDMALASALGMKAIVVLTGETTREHLETASQFPDLALNSIADLR